MRAFHEKVSDLAEMETSTRNFGGKYKDEVWEDENSVLYKYRDNIHINHLYGPMFFGFTSRFLEMIHELDKSVQILIIRMDRVPYIDQSGLYALEEALPGLRIRGVVVFLTGIQTREYLK